MEAGIIQGKGYSYGVEVLLKKNKGKINGWLSYTYSRSYREMIGKSSGLSVNEGNPYASVFDQPHQGSAVINIQLGRLTLLSSNFTYSSGRPITIPISKYSYADFLSINNYSDRNEFRMPDYHRLDLSLTFKGSGKNIYSGDFIISIYNVYGRKNAYSIFFDKGGLAYKTSILGNPFPSVSYNFKIN